MAGEAVTGDMSTERIKGYCGMCIARCGSVAVVEDGRFVALEPDPTHPTGQALCAKGRAAPELVYHPDRLTHPLKRTRPKGDPDPGWQRIGWDEALDTTAAAMRGIAERHGPEAFAFSLASPSTTAIADSSGWIRRLMNAFGTPNASTNLEVCGWGRGFATRYTYGVGSVGLGSGGGAMPDIANSGCLVLWGYNPSISRLTHATMTVEALKRGLRLIVIDPRHAGLANKADVWLRVRPGSDGALALGLANLMIERNWYDRDFIREWSNGPLLVRGDTGRLLTERDLSPDGSEQRYFAWDPTKGSVVAYDAASGLYGGDAGNIALEGEYVVTTAEGRVACRPVFDLYAALCRELFADGDRGHLLDPSRAAGGGGADHLARPSRLLLRLERPRAAHERHADGARHLHPLCPDRKLRRAGRQRPVPSVPSNPITGEDLPSGPRGSPLRWVSPNGRSGLPAGTTSPAATSTAPSSKRSPIRYAACSASAPTFSWRMPRFAGDARL